MDATRRQFLQTVSAAAVAGSVGVKTEAAMVSAGTAGQAGQRGSIDPLGVRADFPVVENGIYLDSPYIAPSPRQVIEAGRAFVDAKAHDPVPLGAMLEETDRVRRKFADLGGDPIETVYGVGYRLRA